MQETAKEKIFTFPIAHHFPFALDFAHPLNESIIDGSGPLVKGNSSCVERNGWNPTFAKLQRSAMSIAAPAPTVRFQARFSEACKESCLRFLSIVYPSLGGDPASKWASLSITSPSPSNDVSRPSFFRLLTLPLRTTFPFGMRNPLNSLAMTRYKASSGDSGVTAYAVSPDSITIEFKDGRVYLYDYRIPGAKEVEIMKLLAAKGRGLTTFINKHVRNRYATRLR